MAASSAEVATAVAAFAGASTDLALPPPRGAAAPLARHPEAREYPPRRRGSAHPRDLIRIIGDRFPWQIKAAILHTLGLLIRWDCRAASSSERAS